MPASSDDSDTPVRRKKARRSCLNCQKSHRTCGNERPCRECKRRGMTETCVDGDRKIPKYLYGISTKTPTANLYCDTSLLHLNRNAHGDSAKGLNFPTWSFNSVNQSGATILGQTGTDESYPIVQSSSDFVDPSILHIESPTLLLSRQVAKSHIKDEEPPRVHLTADVDSLLLPPEGNVASQTWGEKTSIGFTISSGWSSTFLPCGMSDDSGGLVNIS